MNEEPLDQVDDLIETAEPSLRDQLESAVKEVSEKPETAEAKAEPAKSDKSRDDSGKFAKKDEKAPATTSNAVAANEPVKSVITPPNTWTAAAKAKWADLPAEIQAEVAKRESEVEKGFTKLDEERSVGKTFKEVISPYLPMIQAEGGTPITAIQSLLNTAYQLRQGTPQTKGMLLLQLAQQYGADLSVSQNQPQVDPRLQAIQQELAQLKNARQQELSAKEQQEQGALRTQIDTFAADPKNVHFETVKADMAALLQGGGAKDLQEAYDKAVWAHPDIRRFSRRYGSR
jgi:hypothetical protein